MIADTFYWILNMSLVATLAAGCLLLLRRIRTLPRRWIVAFWLLPGIRSIVPFSLGGRGNLIGLLNRLSYKLLNGTATEASVSMFSDTGGNSLFRILPWFRAGGAGGKASFGQALYGEIWPDLFTVNVFQQRDWNTLTEADYGHWKSLQAAQLFTIGGFIWLIVALALLLSFAVLYSITMQELKDVQPLEGRKGVFISGRVSSPALYGIIQPRIVLPERMRSDEQLELIMLHEITHRKRGDNLWRILAFLLVAVHWFNPFSWICLKRVLEDLELACDESVLNQLGESGRKDYASALLGEAENRNVFAAAFGSAPLRVRIDRILSWKRISLLSAVLLTAVFVALAWFLLINPA